MKVKKIVRVLLMLALILTLVGCGKGKEEENEKALESELETSESVEPEESESIEVGVMDTPILNQYYLNEKFMIEMLINDYITIEETQTGIMLYGESEQAILAITISPGIQNLEAAGEITYAMASVNFPDAEIGELMDGYLFGARAKTVNFETFTEEGIKTYGISAGAIVNQTFYNMLVLFEDTAPEIEMASISTLFPTINVLQPTVVNAESKEATYKSLYQESVSTNKLATSPKSSKKSVSEWREPPYTYYSWFGDMGDYASYPSWYFEPDWDYYGYYDNYWDWGWDDDDWWFYDSYSDYYDYDYYDGFDDYWEDYEYNWGTAGLGYEDEDYYDSWSDPGDYGYDYDYETYSDPGDGYDEWSDPGDYGSDYGDYGSDYGDYGDDW